MKVIKHKDKWYLQSETGYKEILLSTDDLLIKDGVQAIDDEFLEWFVKNPSCEEIKVEVVDDNIQWYKIIIPRKNFYCGDEVDYDDKCLEQCDGCVDATGIDYGYLPEDSKQTIIDMMKGDEELGLYDEIQPEQIWNEEKKKGLKELIQEYRQNDTSQVTRVEVIQHSEPYKGRAYTNYNAKDVEIQFQDNGKTLKIFLK